MFKRFANSATAIYAGAGMDLINTIFQVKSNKLVSMERYNNQRTNKTTKNAKKLDDFGDAKLPRTSNERHQKCTRVSRKETES